MATYVSPGVVNPPAGYTAAYPGAGAGSVMDPVSLKIMQGFPKENVGSPGQAGYNPSVNYSHSGVSPINNNQWDLKIDHHFSDTNNISSRYSHKSNPSETAPCFGPSKFDPCTQGPAYQHSAPFLSELQPCVQQFNGTFCQLWLNPHPLWRARQFGLLSRHGFGQRSGNACLHG